MTDEEVLLCRTANRDLFEAWLRSEITFQEALYICRRDRYLVMLRYLGVPAALVPWAGWVYDCLFEGHLSEGC